mmetsp:Transcript_44541/g.53896  ORF Transcript_44541/g.53896 Transcript_44541/m.53896 type:complete len:554 (+) Transcript_44541:117-1778(+)
MASSPTNIAPHTQTDSSDVISNQISSVLSRYPPSIIHRILLTDLDDLARITYNNNPRPSSSYHFHQFLIDNGLISSPATKNIPHEIARTMRKAYFDASTEEYSSNDNNPQPLLSAVISLNNSLRALIPRRTDLHSFIDGDENSLSKTMKDNFFPPLLKAAEALETLQSPDRTDATREWIDKATGWCSSVTTVGNSNAFVTRNEFRLEAFTLAMASAAYLTTLAEQCHEDVINFKLQTFVVPLVRRNPVLFERRGLEQRFPDGVYPATKDWIRRISVSAAAAADSQTCGNRMDNVLRLGIVEDILFSSSTNEQENKKLMPEVLLLDVEVMNAVRNVARLSVMGSSLALTTCHVLGVGEEVLMSSVLDEEHNGTSSRSICLDSERDNLIRAMARGTHVRGELTVEIKDAVLALATAINKSPLTPATTSTILNRSAAILQYVDPVVKLLDSRMRRFFQIMIIYQFDNSNIPVVPNSLRSGRSQDASTRVTQISSPQKEMFVAAAESDARKLGFSFYAHDIAVAAYQVWKIGTLLVGVHWDMLEGLFNTIDDSETSR